MSDDRTIPESLFGNIDGFKDFEFSAPDNRSVPKEVVELYSTINDQVFRGELPQSEGGLVVNPELDDRGISASFVRRDGLDRFWFEFSDQRRMFEIPSSLVHEMTHLLNHLAQWKDIEAGEKLKGHDEGFERIAEAVGFSTGDLEVWPDTTTSEYRDWVEELFNESNVIKLKASRLLAGDDPRDVLSLKG